MRDVRGNGAQAVKEGGSEETWGLILLPHDRIDPEC